MSNEHEPHVDPHDHDPDGHRPGDHDDHVDPDDHAEETGAPLADLPPTPVHGYWKSLHELDGSASLQSARTGHEFPPEAQHASDPLSRRNFFHLMGASMALAGVGGCQRYEKEEIVPLARRPEDQTPGVTQQYATAFELGGVGHGLVATAFEGRPIKLDGNPEHPFASGGIVKFASGGGVQGTEKHAGCSTFAQASILHLYDPDRSQTPTDRSTPSSMEAFRAQLAQLRAGLATAHVLSEATSSPTARALRARLVGLGVQWHEYEPLSWDNERAGTKLAFGERSVRPIARLDRAETIVTLDCDLFIEHPAAMKYSRDFARSRRSEQSSLGPGKMNRLWAIESTFSNTGAMADHRLALRSELGLPFAMALDAAFGGGPSPSAEFLKEPKIDKYLKVLIDELRQNIGKAVIIAGRRQPPEVHALVARINQAIGAPGATLDYVEDPDGDRPTHLRAITDLTKEIAAGRVGTLIMIGGNPVYDAPADLAFADALKSVKASIHLHDYHNETSQLATWHVPRAHFLEAWGDVRTWDGTITIAQPLIAPLYGGLSAIELLSLLLGDEKGGQELVAAVHRELGFEANWRQQVHDGFIDKTAHPVVQPKVGTFQLAPLSPSQQGGSLRTNGELEVVFQQSSFTYDGRYANNAWLWETPDFMTKVTWDNYALVGANTASGLGLENDTLIKVKIGNREIELPCYTIPGQAKGSIGLVLGGGRTAAGRVGGNNGSRRSVGWDTYKVRTTAGWDYATKASVAATGKSYTLANIQEHWDIRTGIGGRPEIQREGTKVNAEGLDERIPELIRETTNRALTESKEWRAEKPEGFFNDLARAGNKDRPGEGGMSLFKEKDYLGHRWAMAIDLSTCTGCNACMVACQAENNIPVVGRNEVMNNREMSWIRIDRYFTRSVEDPQVVHQPIACQQCEQAPCEQVCPVGATTHSDEGLNDMAYNRCIGTRYCANNCPYKVRRFNFLDWNKAWRDARNKVRRLLFNPEVTVRMRGVMEKCTFCVQRIQNTKIRMKAEIRQRGGSVNAVIPDGMIESACQQACPTEAIVFGDLADKSSRVSHLHEDRRSYALLPETYTKPRNRFLARVRNPNPNLVTAPQGGHE
jgi:MoCo/4Fe-4S cofactor protein with predicted Tat translocation signal